MIDVPAAALAQRGRPMADVLDQVPALTAAARGALSAPLPPVPQHGTAAARQEEADGTAAYRAWRDTPRISRRQGRIRGPEGVGSVQTGVLARNSWSVRRPGY
ncbi:hypothetical protein Stsp01_65340 [Streptomyces sp. NBRC 13847]|nr:hypothetical protein Stsp01_65340 [Streptomyces sp. NBRC 13847]